jgi:type I restriction enzyme S subunit
MNADELLSLFDRVSEAPDALAKLRRFVLDLAVRGKLVERDVREEPVSELISALNLGRRSKAKKAAPTIGPILERELPFGVPSNWIWLRLEEIGSLSGGMTPSKSRRDYWDGGVPWISPKDMKSDELCSSEMTVSDLGVSETGLALYPPGSLFMVARSGILKHTFPVSITRVAATVNQDIKALQPYVDGIERYLQIMFRGLNGFILERLVKGGTTVQSLKFDEFAVQPFPFPPLGEQRRIVARVDELMTLCDQLEAARAERERRRDRLAGASLARLNTANPETFQADARFLIGTLDTLAARSDQTSELRQTILNLAVTGKLIPQDENDGTALSLIERLSADKTRMVDAGIISRQKNPKRDADRQIANLPASWTQIALGQVCGLVTSGSRGWAEHYSAIGAGFIRAQNIRFGRLRLDGLAHVKPPANSEGSRTQVASGDLLMVITGAGVTNPALLEQDLGEAYVSQHVGLLRAIDRQISRWLLLCLMAPSGGRAELVDRAYGAGKPGLNLDNIRSLTIPLPPLAEQHRIVARVDELMALCDQLDAAMTAADTANARLLDAILHEALNGAPVAEAA